MSKTGSYRKLRLRFGWKAQLIFRGCFLRVKGATRLSNYNPTV